GCAPECCSSAGCDDGIACTVNECAEDGTCRFTADDALCNTNRADGERERFCDPEHGCIECLDATDCAGVAKHPCQTPVCVQYQCSVTGCPSSQKCCPDGCVGELQLCGVAL